MLKEVYEDIKSKHNKLIEKQNEINVLNNQPVMEFKRPLSIGIVTLAPIFDDFYFGYAASLIAAYAEHR